MNEKKCNCAQPKPRAGVIDGFHGSLTCVTCGGTFDWPLKQKMYVGSDPVEEVLFNLNRNHEEMTVEMAVLTMLLRIERAIRKGK